MLRLWVIAALAGCSFDGPAGSAPIDAAAPDAAPLPACARSGDFEIDPTSGIRLQLVTAQANFDEAIDACVALEARLAVLDSESERMFASTLTETARTYIGLTDSNVDGEWRWVDGTLADLQSPPWGPGRPDNGGQSCGTIRGDGLFDDEGCDPDRDFLCECVVP